MAMSDYDIIRAAIPGASDDVCENVIWGRTAYPFRVVTSQKLYKKAAGFSRSLKNGIVLCDFYDKIARDKKFTCERCDRLLKGE